MPTFAHYSNANFETDVLQASATKPVLVEFVSPVCAPCRMLEPVLEQLATEWQDVVQFGTLDIYESFNLTLQYTVMKAPTLMLFIHGKPVERVTGFMVKEKLVAKFKPHLTVA